MTTPLTITPEMIYAVCSDGRSITAARALSPSQFRDLSANAEGTWLQARCQGSDFQPYRVKADLRDGEASFACTCASPKYPCKHALGLMLRRAEGPGDFKSIASPPAARARVGKHFKLPLAAPAPPEPPPAKDEGEALLRSVYDEPDEDAHRLVYADWLEERGGEVEAARARFIRVQCQAERLREGTVERDQLEAEAQRLLNKHRPRWLADVPAFVRKERMQMVRGFPGRLRMTAEHVGRYGPAMVEKHPVTAVRLTGAVGADEAAELALLPLWGRIRELDLSGMLHQKQRSLAALLASPYLTALRVLRLCVNDLGLAEVQSLVGFTGLGRLEELDLRRNALREVSVKALVKGDLGQLRRLLLGTNRLGQAGIEALAAWTPTAPLEGLDLSETGLSGRSIKALLAAPAVAGVRELDLSGNALDAGAARALADAPALEKVEYLGLAGTGLNAAAQAVLKGRFGDRARFA